MPDSNFKIIKSKYPYPELKPCVPENAHGFFPPEKGAFFTEIKPMALIVELGSWLGTSTRWWLTHSSANVICVDTWRGSIEHQDTTRIDYEEIRSILVNMHDTFIVNQWAWRDRLAVLRMPSLDGLKVLHECEISPDFIFIDASHQFQDVYKDFQFSNRYFPDAMYGGDDWNWINKSQGHRLTVQEAVRKFADENFISVITNGNCWKTSREKSVLRIIVEKYRQGQHQAAIQDFIKVSSKIDKGQFLRLLNTLTDEKMTDDLKEFMGVVCENLTEECAEDRRILEFVFRRLKGL